MKYSVLVLSIIFFGSICLYSCKSEAKPNDSETSVTKTTEKKRVVFSSKDEAEIRRLLMKSSDDAWARAAIVAERNPERYDEAGPAYHKGILRIISEKFNVSVDDLSYAFPELVLLLPAPTSQKPPQ